MSLFNKKSAPEPEFRNEPEPAKSKLSLVLLLLLLVAFGYLYFFTDLIVSHKAPPVKAPEASAPVKQAMPPRSSAKGGAPAAQTDEVKKTEAGAPVAAPAPAAAKPAAPPPVAAAPKKEEAKPAKAPEAKTTPPQKKEEPKVAPLPEKKTSAPATDQKAKQTVPPAPTKEAASPPAGGKQPVKDAKGPVEKALVKKKAVPCTLLIGQFSSPEEIAAAEAKLKKLKIQPVYKDKQQTTRRMTRLFVNAFTDYQMYAEELQKLQKVAKGAFAIEKDGKYSLYAGSFGKSEQAEKEKKRLASQGVPVELQNVTLQSATTRLRAGSFAGRQTAEKAAALVRKEGLAATVEVKKGK